MVDSLAAGRQPETTLLASVGYILRSTAFVGNGLFGMKPFEALASGTPLSAPYEAQMLSAYMLREFVFDLVDWLAAARGDAAVTLDYRLKRYLGVGNSAGLGLVPFVANHPQIIHRWVSTNERALAEARARPVSSDSSAAAAFLTLLDKAVAYFGQEPRDGNGIFASYALLAGELAAIRDEFAPWLRGCGPAGRPWDDLAKRVEQDHHPETAEIVNSLLLEIHPEIVARFEGELKAAERIDIVPAMTVGELRGTLKAAYGWLLAGTARLPEEIAWFWYYPVEAPYEPRRGRRGREPSFEHETCMDLPLGLDALAAALEAEPADNPVAALVARRPELRATVARVQNCAGLAYAELRQNYLAASFTPFATCRFLLAFYGMEKYDPRPPRSTKGALLQGAPLAEDIAAGNDGDWPFPLVPDVASRPDGDAAAFVPLRALESPEVSAKAIQRTAAKQVRRAATDRPLHVFPLELRKLIAKALLADEHALGVAEAVARLAQSTLTRRLCGMDALLDCLRDGSTRRATLRSSSGEITASPLAGILAAADLACADAVTGGGTGMCQMVGASHLPLLTASALMAAHRSFLGAVANLDRKEILVAGPGAAGCWHASIPLVPAWANGLGSLPGQGREQSLAAWLLRSSGGQAGFARSAFLCLAPRAGLGERLADELELLSGGQARVLHSAEATNLAHAVDEQGFVLAPAQFAKLRAMAEQSLVPEDIEQRITRTS